MKAKCFGCGIIYQKNNERHVFCTLACRKRKHYLKYKEKYNRLRKERYKINKEKEIQQVKLWKAKNPTLVNKHNTKFYKKNKGKLYEMYGKNQYEKDRMVSNAKASVNHNRERVLCLIGTKCLKCGKTKNIEIHHKKYIIISSKTFTQKQKKEIVQHLKPLCRDCHRKLHAK